MVVNFIYSMLYRTTLHAPIVSSCSSSNVTSSHSHARSHWHHCIPHVGVACRLASYWWGLRLESGTPPELRASRRLGASNPNGQTTLGTLPSIKLSSLQGPTPLLFTNASSELHPHTVCFCMSIGLSVTPNGRKRFHARGGVGV